MADTMECAAWAQRFWNELSHSSPALVRMGEGAVLYGWRLRLEWDAGGDRGAVIVERAEPRRYYVPGASERFPVYLADDVRRDAREILQTVYMLEPTRTA